MNTDCEPINLMPAPAITDARKTLGALAVFAMARNEQLIDAHSLNREIESRIGTGWSFLTAMQWLGGEKAQAVVQGLAEQGTYGGLSKQAMRDLMQSAHALCQQWPPHANDNWLLARIVADQRQAH
ncbi:hypothetical protein HNQ59_000004 [Chitinivorax tropicus]|uniref:Uncharacterized protein n=1 Tax=Chitinivorax tropicus TaxID=714531 RepID=A0A840MJ92_9PROT|nr:hypothetical protein [Chitinivorax tropicus]MBB5016742.1 hypothetical protein [Chitinivorax tropicus]